ncbi:MAG: ThuA domain-containing protein [Bacillota bacterium]|nr:ThuA domain-containing protein [Bacillota bacterium]
MGLPIIVLGDPEGVARYHPVGAQLPALRRALAHAGIAAEDLDLRIGREAYAASDFAPEALVVNAIDNWSDLDPGAAALLASRLLVHVAAGGRLLIWHQGLIAKIRPDLLSLGAADFTRHDPETELRFIPRTDAEGMAGLGGWTAVDEPYEFDFEPWFDSAVEVLVDYEYQGRLHPIVWSRTFGRGRLVYFGPGHNAASCAPDGFVHCLAACLGRLVASA